MSAITSRWEAYTWPSIAVASTALAQCFVTRAFFWSDDFLNLYRIVNEDVVRFILRMHGAHLLLTRNAIFLLFFHVFGTNEAGYFWAAFLTHLLNVVLLFRLIYTMTASARLGCFGAALWGTLRAHEATLTWHSVYGEVLAATFLLAVLGGLCRAATDGRARRFAPLLWAAELLAASTCFGVGLGATLVMPAIGFLLLTRSQLRTQTVVTFLVAAAVVAILYVATQRLSLSLYAEPPRSMVLIAGLSKWRQHARLFLDMLRFASATVLLGPLDRWEIAGSRAGDALVALYCVGVLWVLVRAPSETRRTLVALILFAAAVYGIIAAGRGTLRSEANAAWLASTPRYHYVGSIAVVAALCLVLAQLDERAHLPGSAKTGLLATWITASVAASMWAIIIAPRNPGLANRTETALALAEMRKAIAAAPTGHDVYIANRAFKGAASWLFGAQTFPGWAGLFTIYFPENTVDGRRVFFIEQNPAIIAAAEGGCRAAALLVAEDPTARDPDRR